MFRGITYLLSYNWQKDKFFLLFSFLSFLFPAFIPVINALLPAFLSHYYPPLSGGVGTLGWVILCYLSLIHFLKITSIWFSKISFFRRVKIAAQYNCFIHEHICKTEYHHLEDPNYINLKARAMKFIFADWHGFSYQIDQLFSLMGQLISCVSLVFIVEHLGIFPLVTAMIIPLIGAFLEKGYRDKENTLTLDAVQAERQWTYFNDLYDNLPFAKDIRINQLTNWLIHKEQHFSASVADAYYARSRQGFMAELIGANSNTLSTVVLVIALFGLLANHEMSIGQFLSFLFATIGIANAVQTIISDLVSLASYSLYYDDVKKYLALSHVHQSNSSQPENKLDCIEFDAVSFRYPGQISNALTNISCGISAGEKIAIVGENGAGKTTFIKLLCRFYQPDDGKIKLNGIEIGSYPIDSYQEIFSSLFQDQQLFNFSIRDNLLLGKSSDEIELLSLLNKMNLIKLIARQHDGIETKIGRLFDPNGFIPSGGEAQRLLLARTILRNKSVIILDEPTASLDPENEDRIIRQLLKETPGKLVIFVTHRLAAASSCDRILVFRHGQLIGNDSHTNLMKDLPYYRHLYLLQANRYRCD